MFKPLDFFCVIYTIKRIMKKIIYHLIFAGIISAILFAIGLYGSKIYFTNQAVRHADAIIATAIDSDIITAEDEIIALSRAVFEEFKVVEPSKVMALRFRPYLSNERLPDFIRFPMGAIEMNIAVGMCDNAARMLHFLLAQKGYKSVQWNMITDKNAHSVLLVYMPDGSRVFVDPLYGFVGFDRLSEELLSPEAIKAAIINGSDLDEVLLPLNENSNKSFYNNFQSVRMAAQGDNLNITADLPLVPDDQVFLGEIDGDNKDVYSAASRNKMTPFWHYMGHKYNRSFVRVLRASQDVRLEMTLLSDINNGIITSDPRPDINGRKLIWNLKSGDDIKFYDGRAKISWKRFNSFVGVDQIAIYLR